MKADSTNGELFPVLLTIQQVGKVLQLSTRTVYRLRSAGKLPPPVEVGGSLRWNREHLRHWIASGCPAWEELCRNPA